MIKPQASLDRALLVVTGVIFAILYASPLVVAPRMPEAGAPASVIVTYVQAHQQGLEWSWFLSGELAWLPGLVFFAMLTGLLWHESSNRAAVVIGFGGAVVGSALTLAVSIPWGLLVYLAPQVGPTPAILLLAEARHFGDAALSIPIAVMLLGYGSATLNLRDTRFLAVSAVAMTGALVEVAHTAVDFLLSGQTGVWLQVSTAALIVWAVTMSVALVVPHGSAGRWPALAFLAKRTGPNQG